MSWSIMVMHLPPNVQSVSDIPKDFSPPPLGTRAEVIDLFKQFAPNLNTDQTDDPYG